MKVFELHNQPVQADTYEASMALNQLLKIGKHAIKIHNMIDDEAEMEAWVAKKIDLAGDYVKKVHGYMQGEKAGLYDDGGMTEDANNLETAYKQIAMLANNVRKEPTDADDQMDVADDVARPITKILSTIMDYDKGEQMPDGSASKTTYVDMYKKLGMLANKGAQTNDPKVAPLLFKMMSSIYDMDKVSEGSIQEDAGEGHMSKSTLYHTAKYAIELMSMINKGDDLEGWVQSKLNKAADYLQGVHNYEEYQKLNPYREELDANILQKHAGIVQKHIDEILAKETKLDDVDTKPGMMRILAKRVNEVEKEIAKEQRKNTDEAHGGEHSTSGRSMSKGEMNKREKIVKGMKKNKAGFKKRYGKDAEAVMYATATKQAMKDDEVNEDPRTVGKALANLEYGKAMADAILKGKDTMRLIPMAQAYISGVDQTLEMLKGMYPKRAMEDGHTDIPSAIRNCETIIEDAIQMKQKLQTMQGELPSWMTQMIAVAASDLNDARDYLLNPTTESGIMYRAGVKKYGKAGMKAIQSAAGKGASHQEIGKIKDKYLKDAEELEEGLKDWARNTAMAGIIVAGLAGVGSINDAIDRSVPAIGAMETALEMANDSGNDELADMIEKDLSDAKIRLNSGKDLSYVKDLQSKYAKFIKTEGLAYESKLAINLNQRLK